MSKQPNRIPPPPKGKKEFTDDSSETPNNTENKVPGPDWEIFPDIAIKDIDFSGDANKRLNKPELKLSTLFNELPEIYE